MSTDVESEPLHGPLSLRAGSIEMDIDRHEVYVDGREVALPPKEFALLEAFLMRPGYLLTRENLVSRVWSPDYFGDTRTLDVHIRRLRAKIEEDPRRPKHLVTVRGYGYKLRP